MASPVVESLCCLPSKPKLSQSVLGSFASVQYNTVCLLAAMLGITGAIWQLQVLRAWRPLSAPPQYRRVSMLRTCGPNIVWWLAVADLCAAAGIAVRSCLFLTDKSMIMGTGTPDSVNRIICIIVSSWIHYFYTVTYLWTLLYCIDCTYSLRGMLGSMRLYHHITWPLSAILTTGGLLFLYAPDLACHSSGSNPYFRFLPNYLSTVLPLAVVLLMCPVLYCVAAQQLQIFIAGVSGRYTLSERTIVAGVKRRFLFMCLVFWLCWLPNIINAIVLWTTWNDLPYTFLTGLWYAMGVLNPMQALFNSFVYPSQSARSSICIEGCSIYGCFFGLLTILSCGLWRRKDVYSTWLSKEEYKPGSWLNTNREIDDVEHEVYEELSSSEYQSASSSPHTIGSQSCCDEHTSLLHHSYKSQVSKL